MDMFTKLFVRITEHKGQTMTEYALIMAAIAVVVYTAYKSLGGAITNTVANVTASL